MVNSIVQQPKQIINLADKAKTVFEFIRLMAKAHPDKTLGQILDFDEQSRMQELGGRDG